MKKVLSLVLALGMAVSSVGMVSFAEEDADSISAPASLLSRRHWIQIWRAL